MRHAALASVVLFGILSAAVADEVGLAFQSPRGPVHVALGLDAKGNSAESRWSAFFEKLIAHYDRNGDGFLDEREAARIPPLPLPDGTKYRFTTSGKLKPASLRKLAHDAGYRPLVVRIAGPSADDSAVAAWLAQSSRTDLIRAMRILDLDDNEVVDEAELKAIARSAKSASTCLVAESSPKSELPVRLSAAGIRLRSNDAAIIRDGLAMLGDGAWILAIRSQPILDATKSVRGFLLSQFEEAAKGAGKLLVRDLETDADLGGLAALAPYADNDDDGVLTRREVEEHFELVRLALSSQAVLAVADHAGNILPILDADQDCRWTTQEFSRGRDLLTRRKDPAAVRYAVIRIEQPRWSEFAGVPLAKTPRLARPTAKAAAAPDWFRAMDANGDGVVSEREFLGPARLFRSLDTDRDGLLTIQETAHLNLRP